MVSLTSRNVLNDLPSHSDMVLVTFDALPMSNASFSRPLSRPRLRRRVPVQRQLRQLRRLLLRLRGRVPQLRGQVRHRLPPGERVPVQPGKEGRLTTDRRGDYNERQLSVVEAKK